MSEMIERVMAAIAVNLDVEPGGQLTREAARAAIEAMREPTPKMVESGKISVILLDDSETSAAGPARNATWIWKEMIDEALT